jgi:hypothetical protein
MIHSRKLAQATLRDMNVAPVPSARAVVITLAIACVLLATAGCSGRPKNVARSVMGKVTLGGQPLPDATIVFTPTAEGGSPSMGRTDAEGNYKLVWGRDRRRVIEGAQIGEHTVRISTFMEGAPSAKPPRPDVPEKVPYKYRAESPPTATVIKGSNVINFELEPGPVDPPQPKGKTKGRGK